jgi:hypothetical protein
MSHPAARALAEAADTIRSAARDHKRAAEAHRREARALMAKLDLIRQECKRLGIDLHITEASRKERHSDATS